LAASEGGFGSVVVAGPVVPATGVMTVAVVAFTVGRYTMKILGSLSSIPVHSVEVACGLVCGRRLNTLFWLSDNRFVRAAGAVVGSTLAAQGLRRSFYGALLGL